MDHMRQGFEKVRFTQEEKSALADRLRKAAEQREHQTDTARKTVRKLRRGLIFGVAAALILTVGGPGGGSKRDLGRTVFLPVLRGTGPAGEADL